MADMGARTLQEMLPPDLKFDESEFCAQVKQEYLKKIIEKVEIQNKEYYQNLTCEYNLQLRELDSSQSQSKIDEINMCLHILYCDLTFITRDETK